MNKFSYRSQDISASNHYLSSSTLGMQVSKGMIGEFRCSTQEKVVHYSAQGFHQEQSKSTAPQTPPATEEEHSIG